MRERTFFVLQNPNNLRITLFIHQSRCYNHENIHKRYTQLEKNLMYQRKYI